MASTTVGNDELTTGLILDRFVQIVNDVYEILEPDESNRAYGVRLMIKNFLDEYEAKYGKNAPRCSKRTGDRTN